MPGVIDLFIGYTAVDIEGRRATATTINGTIPGPLLRLREGQDVTLRVTNGLDTDTSVHWHGLIVPAPMDGVPGVSFPGIPAGESFTYRFPLRQYGTYWYHSHSAFQEQKGVYGPLVIDPVEQDPIRAEREHVVMLSDWTFEDPHDVIGNLKKYPGYYNLRRRTLGELVGESRRDGLWDAVQERWAWSKMRMDPTDIADITGMTYTYLLNGRPPGGHWTGLFRPRERVRLRLINGSAATFFDVRVPGLRMTVVQADGQNVRPVVVDELRIAVAETYDVIVEPGNEPAYAIFAEAMDRSGFAIGNLVQRPEVVAPVPPRRDPPRRSMADMGMEHGETGEMGMRHGAMANGDGGSERARKEATGAGPREHDGQHRSSSRPATVPEEGHPHGGAHPSAALRPPGTIPPMVEHGPDTHGPANAAVPMMTRSRLAEAGVGLDDARHRVLVYTDLVALEPHDDQRPPSREIELHLTGNMERFMWSIDGKKFSEAEPIRIELGERVRMTLVNDTMMEHPMHIHGMWMVLENGHGKYIPRKHTINVKPAERLSYLITADNPGPWAFHCHVLYHMEVGMFRVVEVVPPARERREHAHGSSQEEPL